MDNCEIFREILEVTNDEFFRSMHAPVSCFEQGNVESWLADLLKTTRASVHNIIRQAAISITDPTFKLLEFENTYPAQVLLFI